MRGFLRRQLNRPDGWRATGISCGTSCGVCGPDPYGAQTPVCEHFADAEGLACDDASFAESWNPCSNGPGVRLNNPAYCGHSLPGIAQGDPNMLYVCEAYCPRWEGEPEHMAPCEGSEGLGGGSVPRTRRCFLDHSVYCAFGCQSNGDAKSDECKRPGGGKRAAPIADSYVIRGFGVVAEDYGGRHLGEDLVRISGGTAGAEVHPVADGRLLWKGLNGSLRCSPTRSAGASPAAGARPMGTPPRGKPVK